ncbi:MAG: hypothetical protein A7315_12510 [Candidatus Altiarchaeales archaeon WOR_SM1_79]|nr:MAG: hypothetical protein A7315_12510 [Candidatus Altiarchaeales archaeon WOR_SM1_79]
MEIGKNGGVSVIILNTNELEDLKECVPSVLDQTYPNYEVIIVDNASSDGSIEYIKNIKKKFANIRLVRNSENLGYARGNNTGIEHASTEFVVILNPDTVVERNWLEEMVLAIKKDPMIGMATPKIFMYNENKGSKGELINTCGNDIHFTGLSFCRGFNKKGVYNEPEVVAGISGCSFIVRKKLLDETGCFDPDHFIYLEDTDLSFRAQIAGYKLIFIPSSVMYHKYNLNLNPKKYFYLERNRLFLLLKNYQLRTLMLCIPSLILTEVITSGYAILSGWGYIKSKIRAHLWILRNINKIIERRKEVQRLRKVNDREIFNRLIWGIRFEQLVANKSMRRVLDLLFNPLFRVHYKILVEIL